jgi:isopenicillin-N epimerase
MSDSPINWKSLRDQVELVSGAINLNAGSCSPALTNVCQKLNLRRAELQNDPVSYIWDSNLKDIEVSRQKVARFINCEAANLLMYRNSTMGFGIALNSADLPEGSEVLISDQEYGHIISQLSNFAKQKNIKIKTVNLPMALDGNNLSSSELANLFLDKMNAKVSAIFISHVTSATGLVLPVKKICEAAREKGIVSIIDGAHAPGLIPLDLKSIDADFYFGNGHKWLMGCVGAAFLYVTNKYKLRLSPLMKNSYFEKGLANPDKLLFEAGPTLYSYGMEYQGTEDRGAQAVLGDAVSFREEIGVESVFERMSYLRNHCSSIMGGLGYERISFSEDELRSPLVSYKIPKVDEPRAIYNFYQKYKIQIAMPVLRDDFSILRLSHAWFNQPEEYDELAGVLENVDWAEF